MMPDADGVARVSKERRRRDFERAREGWARRCCSHPRHSTAAKLLSYVLGGYFNFVDWKRTGRLEAFPGIRRLEADMGISRKTVLKAIAELEDTGHVEVLRGGNDPKTGHHIVNHYRAAIPLQVDTPPLGGCHVGTTRQVESLGGPVSTITSEAITSESEPSAPLREADTIAARSRRQGSSMRSISRVADVSINTVSKLLPGHSRQRP